MQTPEIRALLTIALMAAFADGAKADAERQEIQRIARDLGAQAGGLSLGTLVQDVLLQQVTLEQAAGALTEPGLRQLAYEWAVGVCDADGTESAAERQFLASLQAALGLDGASTRDAERQANARPTRSVRPRLAPSAATTATATSTGS